MIPIGAARAGVVSGGGDAIPDSGVSRWTFDTADTDSGTALDSWANNDGTINGATTGVTGANQTYTTNEAYGFDGADDYVSVGNAFQVATGSFSISFWLNYDSLIDLRPISKSLNASDSGFTFYENDGWTWFVGGEFVDVAGNATSAGVWYHFVCILDTSDNTGYIYQDATEVASGALSPLSTDDGEFEIGADRTGTAQYSDTAVDDVRVYSKALSPTEVSNLYNTGSIS